MLRCRDGSLYTGVSNDVPARVTKHNDGKGAAYTRSRRPVVLVYQRRVRGRSAALKAEVALKRLNRGEKLLLVAAARARPVSPRRPSSSAATPRRTRRPPSPAAAPRRRR